MTETDTSKHIVLLIFLAIACIVLSGFVKELSSYSFIAGIMIILFIFYLKLMEVKPDFIQKDYDCMLGDKLYYDNVKNYDKSFKGVFLTGEDVFPYKKLFDCEGLGVFNFDTYPEEFLDSVDEKGNKIKVPFLNKEKMKSKKTFIIWYYVYSIHGIISLLQKFIPRLPFISDILGAIPFIKGFCFPTARAVLVPEDIIKFKSNIIEINGLSLMPLSIKETFNTFSVVEYTDKFNEMRKFERFIFDKTLSDYGSQEMINTALNTANASAKLNPKVKIEQEQSIIKTR